MAADALATQVARASTAMVLTMCVDSEFLVFNKEQFQPPVPSHILRNDTKLCAENMVKYIHKKGYWNWGTVRYKWLQIENMVLKWHTAFC